MTTDNTAKVSSRRGGSGAKSRSSKQTNTSTVEANAMSGENTVKIEGSESTNGDAAKDNVVKITARPVSSEGQQQGSIQLHNAVSLSGNRPVMPNTFEIVDTIQDAGMRPIGSSSLHLAGSFSNGRPIEASNLVVQETLPGNRPIFASNFALVESSIFNRPIMASDPVLLEGSFLPGNRPIASNDIDDPEAIMGFLD